MVRTQRRDFKDSSGAKPGQLFPLSEIVVPLHAEVRYPATTPGSPLNVLSQIRTLLSDHLTDEEQGSVSGRNPLASINEILREGKFGRDRSKVPVLPSISGRWRSHLPASTFSGSQMET